MSTATKPSLTKTQTLVLGAITKHPTYTVKEIAQVTHITPASIRTHMTRLRKLGVLPKGAVKRGRPTGSKTKAIKRGTTRRTYKTRTTRGRKSTEVSKAIAHLTLRRAAIERKVGKLNNTIEAARAQRDGLMEQRDQITTGLTGLGVKSEAAITKLLRQLPR